MRLHHQIRRTAAIIVVGVFVLLAMGCGDGDDDVADTTSTAVTTTSTGPTTTEPTTSAATDSAGAGVVWPPDGGATTYTDPVAAATGFAVGLVGFTDPVVGEFLQGDSRSGEVEVRPAATGPVTTVFVRQVGVDEAWSVIGCATDEIRPTNPEALAEIASPVQLDGTSTAFEGNVEVAVHDRSGGEPLGRGFVTGGSMGELAPFASTLEFGTPATAEGSVVFTTRSMEDGRVWNAAVVGVRFAASSG